MFSSIILVLAMFTQAAIADNQFGGLMDPTAPISFEASGVDDETVSADLDSFVSFSGNQSYSLSSVLIMRAKKYAVINGQTVEEGAVIGSARVKKIDKAGVTLEQGHRTSRLTLHAGTVRKEDQ